MRNIGRVLRKDLRLGPRSPFILYAFVLPVIMTLLIRSVFGGLFDAKPRLAIVDLGASQVTADAMELDGIEVSLLSDADTLRNQVESHDFDAGLVLPAGFDEAVRSGTRPEMALYISGESLASDRVVLAVTTIDLVREVSGEPPPVEVEVISFGEESLELSLRLLPLIMIYAVAIAGAMVPALSLVEEKEQNTIDALLVSPASVHELMAAKVLLGVILAFSTGVMTLAINDAFSGELLGIVITLLVAAVMMAEVGVILGAWAANTNTMFTVFKGGGIFLFYPVVFFIWPDLPSWIARMGPTYYFLQPIFDLAVGGAGFGDVAGDIAIGAAICLALIPAVLFMGRWLERSRGGGAAAVPEKELEGV
ncbi:MAG: ABC transporter permease [Acidimicrobiia bacterium]|nr:ABC transporter permease [Acidimicrobiia bacterium]